MKKLLDISLADSINTLILFDSLYSFYSKIFKTTNMMFLM